MIENFEKLFYENDFIYDNIFKLFIFLDNILNLYNYKIVQRFRKLDFYDMFFICSNIIHQLIKHIKILIFNLMLKIKKIFMKMHL